MEYRNHVRKYLRFTPSMPFNGSIRIVRVGDRVVSTGTTTVKILEICQGGLRFVTSLRLPMDSNFIIEVNFTIGGEEHQIEGYAVHCENSEVLEYVYGISFITTDDRLKRSLQKQYSVEAEKYRKHIFILNTD